MNLVRHEGNSPVEFPDRFDDHEKFIRLNPRLSRPVANMKSATCALALRDTVSAREDTFCDYIRRGLAFRSLIRVNCFVGIDFGKRINISRSEFYGRKT